MNKKIEFFGLSGSGKSTLSQEFSHEFKIRDINRSNVNFSYFSFTFILSVFSSLFLILKITMLTKTNVSNLFKPYIFSYYCFYLHNKGYVTGHGFIQNLTQNESLEFYLIENPDKISKIISFFPDLNYIYVNVEKKLAFKRANKRNKNSHNLEKYDLDLIFFEKILILKKIKIFKNNSNSLASLRNNVKKFK